VQFRPASAAAPASRAAFSAAISGKAQTCAGKRIGIRAQQLGETAELREQVLSPAA